MEIHNKPMIPGYRPLRFAVAYHIRNRRKYKHGERGRSTVIGDHSIPLPSAIFSLLLLVTAFYEKKRVFSVARANPSASSAHCRVGSDICLLTLYGVQVLPQKFTERGVKRIRIRRLLLVLSHLRPFPCLYGSCVRALDDKVDEAGVDAELQFDIDFIWTKRAISSRSFRSFRERHSNYSILLNTVSTVRRQMTGTGGNSTPVCYPLLWATMDTMVLWLNYGSATVFQTPMALVGTHSALKYI
ncbi:hypothetical protein B0H13DRAFT_1853544 [Mycena leptocephala]|nr:hypothetical protein B0H13DRAFT_1853544 [Mycena leptocephala]